MYNIFQKQIYIKYYNNIRVSHRQLTSGYNEGSFAYLQLLKQVANQLGSQQQKPIMWSLLAKLL